MNTEKKLKDRCTPAFIKWMVELAEGFEIIDEYYINFGKDITTPVMHIFASPIFPLLIHRTVEGWNKTNDLKIRIFDEEIHTKKRLDHFAIGFYQFKNYQSQSLTKAECAMLHCLLDVFKKQEERDEL